jgi:hypothetical protein
MAALILENDGLVATGAGGYFDFDPKNRRDIESIQNILASRRADKWRYNRPVTLLSASGEDTETLLGRILATVISLFTNDKSAGSPVMLSASLQG